MDFVGGGKDGGKAMMPPFDETLERQVPGEMPEAPTYSRHPSGCRPHPGGLDCANSRPHLPCDARLMSRLPSVTLTSTLLALREGHAVRGFKGVVLT